MQPATPATTIRRGPATDKIKRLSPGDGAVAIDIVTAGFLSVDAICTTRASAKEVPGGAALYSALGASVFLRTGVVARVGSDFPQDQLERLGTRLDTSGIVQVEGGSTRFDITYDETWNEQYDQIEFGVGQQLVPADMPKSFEGARAYYIALMPPEQMLAWIEHVRENDAIVGGDTNAVFIRPQRDASVKVARGVDVFFPNHKEATLLTGKEDPRTAALKLAEHTSVVAVKDGANGAYIAHDGRVIHFPGFHVDVVDTTGAGDAFAGAFMASYAKHGDVERAGWLANATASFNVRRLGTRGLEELDESVLPPFGERPRA